MCLGVPGKIIEIYQKEGLSMAQVDFSGVTREACIEHVPEAEVGDYAIIHVGFAISLLSEEEAQDTLALLREIVEAGEQFQNQEQIPPAETDV
ncbi:MAG: HypC/HybG/HupF family hydrogenase formation chaperone [Anaerolineales bacterium]|nr:HypC/HybG/HupF family hydrogenase formation chaperone [Anaerolineales bacterium]